MLKLDFIYLKVWTKNILLNKIWVSFFYKTVFLNALGIDEWTKAQRFPQTQCIAPWTQQNAFYGSVLGSSYWYFMKIESGLEFTITWPERRARPALCTIFVLFYKWIQAQEAPELLIFWNVKIGLFRFGQQSIRNVFYRKKQILPRPRSKENLPRDSTWFFLLKRRTRIVWIRW